MDRGEAMNIIPNTTIYLYSLPLTGDYRDSIYFDSLTAQNNFFETNYSYKLDKYLYQRKDIGTLKVGIPANYIYMDNYMRFQNTSHSTKWFYAFITSIEYVNEETTLIHYEIDVLQTWMFQINYMECFIEREHTRTDYIGENILPENLERGPYIYDDPYYPSEQAEFAVVVAATFDKSMGDAYGGYAGGIYSGLAYNVFPYTAGVAQTIGEFLAKATSNNKAEGIVSIFMIPRYFSGIDPEPDSTIMATMYRPKTFGNYKPRNNKLFTSPYLTIYVTNNEGGTADYPYEYFEDKDTARFSITGALSCVPQISIAPQFFKKVNGLNFNEQLTCGNYPQCAFTIDSYRAWLAQNQGSLTAGIIGDAINSFAGSAANILTGNYAGAVSGTVNYLTSVGNLCGQVTDMKTKPPQAKGENASQVNVANGIKGFQLYNAMITEEYARSIDNFLTLFGYSVNKLGTPCLKNRERYTFIKTRGANMVGSIPSDDLEKIRSIFDNGVTWWVNASDIGNYYLDNKPLGGGD